MQSPRVYPILRCSRPTINGTRNCDRFSGYFKRPGDYGPEAEGDCGAGGQTPPRVGERLPVER